MDRLACLLLTGHMTTTNGIENIHPATELGIVASNILRPSLFAGYLRPATVAAAAGAGIVGGVLFAFSTFVMPALRSLPDEQGMAAMQAINKFAPTPVFMSALFGTALLSLGLGISALGHLGEPGGRFRLAGSTLYLATILITASYHVPHNNALALVSPMSPGAGTVWRHYAASWTLWNHLRTTTAIAGSISLTLSLLAR
jgi:uncharacterized membrane protein